jgi:hypothetical protein
MKRIILSFAFVVTAGTMVAMADPGTTTPGFESAFKKEFSGAQNVKWNEDNGYMKATFVLNEHRTIAWFTKEGEFQGSLRNIFFTQLPLTVVKAVNTRFEANIPLDITEVVNTEGTRYSFTLEYKSKKYKVSVSPDGNIDDVRKVKS